MLIVRIVQLFVTWLLIASLVGLLVKRVRLPYTVGLVLVGLGLAILVPFLRDRPQLLSPEEVKSLLVPNLILTMLVPPLVYEAAFHVRIKELRAELRPILAFAIPGVVLTMLLVAAVVAWGSDIALPLALVFGALTAATDPVAVVALFRALGAPKRLVLLLEGESLFNDGTAIVVFHLMLGVVATGEFLLVHSLLNFLWVAVGGFLVGWLVGRLVSFVISRVDDHYIEISLSIVAAYGSYLLAEHFHLAGVLAVVAAGLFSGNLGTQGMSESTRAKLFSFWEFAAFLANTFVFLLIGLVIDLDAVIGNLGYAFLAVLAVLLARAVVIYGLSRLLKGISTPFQHVLLWGGLRGAISLALVLSLTVEEIGPDLGLLQAMAFGVVLFTLLVQGTTMAPLMRRLKLVQPSS